MNDDPVRRCLAAYDDWAASYDAIDNPLIAVAAEVLAGRVAWLSGARVVELGCGTGRNAAACLAAGATHYLGLDASPGMLAVARARAADSRVSWRAGDLVDGAAELAATGERFDVVLIVLVLEHVAEVAPVLRAAASLLAPGGRVMILELHAALHARGIGANFRVGEAEVRLPSYPHEAAELVAAAEAAGLRVAAAESHVPQAAALARSRKLARYAGQEVLLELVAL